MNISPPARQAKGLYVGDPNLGSTSSSPPVNEPHEIPQNADVGAGISRNPSLQLYLDFGIYRNTCLALTNRQIYSETSKVFYAYNGFHFSKAHAMLVFLRALGRESRQHIRSLRYLPADYSYFEMGDLSAALIQIRVNFPSLQHLELAYRESVIGENNRDLTRYQPACLYDFFVRDPLHWLFRSPDFRHGPSYDTRDADLTDEQRYHQGFMAYRSHETEDEEMPHGDPIFERPRLNELAWRQSKTGTLWRPVFYLVIEEKSRWQRLMTHARDMAEVQLRGFENGKGSREDVESGPKSEESAKATLKKAGLL